MNTRGLTKQPLEKAMLYRVVYSAKLPRVAVVLLCAFFLMHPTTQALAVEEVVTETAEAEDAAAEATEVSNDPAETEAVETEVDAEEDETLEASQETETADTSEDEAVQNSPLSEDDLLNETENNIGDTDESSTDSPAAVETETTDGTEPTPENTVDTEQVVAENTPATTTDAAKSTISSAGATSSVAAASVASSTVASSTIVAAAGSSTDTVEITEESTEVDASAGTSSDQVDPENPETSEEEEPVGQVAGVATDVEEDETTSNTEPSQEVSVTDVSDSEAEIDTENTPEENDSATDAASSSEETVVPAPEYFEIDNEVSHSDAHYQFQKTQCVSMGDGSFYCADNKLINTEKDEAQRLYSALDEEGDLEIYLRTSRGVEQITDNTYDDASPFYDPVSDSVVWHRLIKGRYQVMSYDGDGETQITSTRNNSMEPKRSGDHIVWQEWIGDNWEVMLYTGGEIERLTENTIHDMAPYVQGEYVIWTTTDGETKEVSVYDINTKLTSVIEDSDGGRVENPRFVLVYDEKLDNGDVITKGFNPDTGKVAPLAAQPGSVPERLPTSDSTGETRALIQNKPGAKEDFAEEIAIGSSSSTDASGSDAEPEAQELNPDVDLTETGTSTDSDTLELTDFDIIVEPYATNTSAQEGDTGTTTDTVE